MLPLNGNVMLLSILSGSDAEVGASHLLGSAFPLSCSPALSFVKIPKPRDVPQNPPEWACLGVEEKGSAAFIYTLIRDEQRSEHLQSLPPPRTWLTSICSTGYGCFCGGLRGDGASNVVEGEAHPALTFWLWSWPSVLGWAGGILLHQLLVTRVTHSLRLDA